MGGCTRVLLVFVYIRKAFPRVRREILLYQMHKIGILTIYIQYILALYPDTQGSARGLTGFFPTFPIAQGTREGFILSPLFFLISVLTLRPLSSELSCMRAL